MAALLKDTVAPVFPSPVSSRRALEAVQFCLGVGQALKKTLRFVENVFKYISMELFMTGKNDLTTFRLMLHNILNQQCLYTAVCDSR